MFCHIWNILCGMRYLFIVEEQTLIPLVSRLVVFLYPFLRKRGKLMKAMLSQPMAGKTDEEIIQTRERAIRILKEKVYEIVNTLFKDEW